MDLRNDPKTEISFLEKLAKVEILFDWSDLEFLLNRKLLITDFACESPSFIRIGDKIIDLVSFWLDIIFRLRKGCSWCGVDFRC